MGNREDQSVRLPDGRNLGFAEYGDGAGKPLLYFPGLHQSRHSARLMDAPCVDLGIRMVAVDRPGIGLSDPDPARSIPDWPADVAVLADALGIGPMAILAFCGGAPYALACAALLPERISRVSIVGGMAPLSVPGGREGMSRPDRLFWLVARGMPGMLRLYLKRTAESLDQDPDGTLDQMSASFCPPDRMTLSDPSHRAVVIASLRETYGRGIEGDALDAQLLAQPWGFDLSGILTEVIVWHGAEDATAPPAMGEFLAGKLASARLQLLPGEGHVSLLSHHRRKILEQAV